MKEDRRQFPRHPLQVPIRVRIAGDPIPVKSQTGDLSEGGLYFYWTRELSKGTGVFVAIPVLTRVFEMTGEVAYSSQDLETRLYRTGVSFTQPTSAFRAKLAEEILRIREFREKASETAGRRISEEEAARKWIKKYAEKFSEIYH